RAFHRVHRRDRVVAVRSRAPPSHAPRSGVQRPMSFAAILLLAIGLAMDATAVSAARGLRAPKVRARDAVTVALVFGGLQAAMPVLGWLVGAELGPVIRDWDHWIAFGLLAAIGGK